VSKGDAVERSHLGSGVGQGQGGDTPGTLPVLDTPAANLRAVRASGKKANATNAYAFDIVRNVRNVRGFREKKISLQATTPPTRGGALVPGSKIKPPTSRTPRTKPMDIGLPGFVVPGAPRDYEHDLERAGRAGVGVGCGGIRCMRRYVELHVRGIERCYC
jgi:hypothetical protein